MYDQYLLASDWHHRLIHTSQLPKRYSIFCIFCVLHAFKSFVMALRDGKCKLLNSSILLLLLITRIVIQPYYSLISDCDETFNYWEPLNLLVRGFGKQTWEYSPEYSIRSWAFLLPLYGILKPLNQVIDSKVLLFYTDVYKRQPRHLTKELRQLTLRRKQIKGFLSIKLNIFERRPM